MTTIKKATAAGNTLTTPKARTGKSAVSGVVVEECVFVTAKSGKVIKGTVTTHRDALKRLADR